MEANSAVEKLLSRKCQNLANAIEADVISYAGIISDGADDAFREVVESKKPKKKKEKLAVLLETPGGYIDVAERIVATTRRHYREVDFYIPSSAMSAGTVLVLSGDSIHMDYYSLLGPIDPQVQRPGGSGMIPALGYLIQYERLIDKDRRGVLTTAEAQILISCFDQAELHKFEQARDLTITLLRQWLTKYKFKNWTKTQTQGRLVTEEIRQERASEIATKLNDFGRWHSHSRGISMEVLRRELNLQVEDFGERPDLSAKIRSYFKLLMDYKMKRGHANVMHSPHQYIVL